MDDKVHLSKIVNVVRLPTDHLGGTAYTRRRHGGDGRGALQSLRRHALHVGHDADERSLHGQRAETSLGLYDYGARWYDPALGHFLSPDTLVPAAGAICSTPAHLDGKMGA